MSVNIDSYKKQQQTSYPSRKAWPIIYGPAAFIMILKRYSEIGNLIAKQQLAVSVFFTVGPVGGTNFEGQKEKNCI